MIIGVIYAQRYFKKWDCGFVGPECRWTAKWDWGDPRPLPTCHGWACNESFWLWPHVAQAMCWGENP